jgi:hypothetical protein
MLEVTVEYRRGGLIRDRAVRESVCQCKQFHLLAISPCLSLTERETREAMWSMSTFHYRSVRSGDRGDGR